MLGQHPHQSSQVGNVGKTFREITYLIDTEVYSGENYVFGRRDIEADSTL